MEMASVDVVGGQDLEGGMGMISPQEEGQENLLETLDEPVTATIVRLAQPFNQLQLRLYCSRMACFGECSVPLS